MASRIKTLFTPKRIRVLQKMAGGVVATSVPVVIWWNWSIGQRNKRDEEVRTRVRVPNVQSIDDLMIERCRPGDVLLFDRRWEHCATSPLSALVCILGRALLCSDDPNKAVQDGRFDHCGTFYTCMVSCRGHYRWVANHKFDFVNDYTSIYRYCRPRIQQEKGR